MEKEMIYSKFRALNYKSDDNSQTFWERNKYIKDIFEHSTLIAQNYKEFNDIDECVYFVAPSIRENIVKDIYSKKQEKVICSFSCFTDDNDDGKELMWAHYANSSKGIKIDFTVDYEFSSYIKPVEYKSKKFFDTNEKLEEEFKIHNLENIMCRKSTAWKYEQEHRAIFEKNDNKFEPYKYKVNKNGKTKYFFPINIQKITLGKGFFLDTRASNPEQAQQDFKNHILKIASFIYDVLKNTDKYSSQMPKFYYYENKYSQELVEIKTEKLEEYIKKKHC